MEDVNIVLITGMSGAGKSTAMSVLEDMGYHCIDQFPVELMHELGKLLRNSSDVRYHDVALATTALDYIKFLVYFENIGMNVRVLFLDASNEKLLHRYKYTRRQHPFLVNHMANTLEEAIEMEREYFNAIKERASIYRVDTTYLPVSQLKSHIENYLKLGEKSSFGISFVSFGYKNGIPMDSDLLFDVRFLPNPFYVDELRHLTGNDQPVYDYVMNAEQTKECVQHIVDFLDYVLPQYELEGKNHLTVGIGCTGGQHRSVSITNYLYDKYSKNWNCFKAHREIRN